MHYLMYPAIKDDKIAFVTEDDLWVLDGTSLKRLTEGLGIIKFPRFSEDGKYIAFSLYRNVGQESLKLQGDLFIVPVSGKEIKRVTYTGSAYINVIGWHDNRIYFASSHSTPLGYYPEIYTVSPDGKNLERMNYGNASYIEQNGEFTLLGRNIGDPARWKRYRGGTAGQLWVARKGRFERLLKNLNGNIGSPFIFNGRIYFISDHEGIGKIYSTDLQENVKVHTENRDYYVRNASTDGKKIIYQMAGDLFILENDRCTKLDIDVYGTKRMMQSRYIENPMKFLEHFALDEKGENILFTVRGKLFKMRNWDGAVSITERIRIRLGTFLKDETYAAILNENGREDLILLRDGQIIEKIDLDLGLINHLWTSKTGKYVSFSNNRLELYIYDIESRKLSKIDDSVQGKIEYFDFSPDEQWCSYSIGVSNNRTLIRIKNIKDGRHADIVSTYRMDISPSFDQSGRYLYFISMSGHKAVDELEFFNLTFPNPSKMYMLALSATVHNPFLEKLEEGTKDLEIDLDDLDRRLIEIPIKEGRYFRVVGLKNGFIYFSQPFSMDQNAGELHYYNLETKKDEVIVEKLENFTFSGDRSRVAYRDQDSIRIITPTEKKEIKSSEPGKESGFIDTKRIKLFVCPDNEKMQMLSETWLLMRENYWRDEGINWTGIYAKYAMLLDKISTRSELSDLIWELQGELGTSHSFEYLGDYANSPVEMMGHLGAEISYAGAPIIKKIYRGRLSDRSPLLGSGMNIMENDIIKAINGIAVKDENIGKHLINHADDIISITVERDKKECTYTLKTVSDQSVIIYRDWVESNKKYVHQMTGGRVGYLHIPDMMNFGYSEFHKNYLEEVDHEAIIVDVRFNRGGYVSALLLEKLNRKIIGFDNPRHGLKIEYPPESPKGPVVAITNEYSGSDGDIFSHSFKLMKIGPLIGTRTWGGVIGINPDRKLVDGSIVTQPEYAFWFKDVGFRVENYGTDPDIVVDMTPEDYASNKDVQLDMAIKIAMDLLEKR